MATDADVPAANDSSARTNRERPGRRRVIAGVLFACVLPGITVLERCLSTGSRGSIPERMRSTEVRPLHPPLLLEPLIVTGSLGEFRNGSFHYGLDFSTGGEVGAPVHSVDDGFVRRVMFGRYGIGYAIWIEHPDGRLSKYGHLHGFAQRVLDHPAVAALAETIELRKDFVLNLPDDNLRVRRGEVIALSGETGVGFPHLHFEYIAAGDGESQDRLNPLQFGLQLADARPPIFNALLVSPADDASRLNGKSETLRIALEPQGPPTMLESGGEKLYEQIYVPARPVTLSVSGAVVFQLDAYDAAEPEGHSRLGLTEGALFRTKQAAQPLFAFQFSRLPVLPAYRHGLLFDRFGTKLSGGARYVYNYFERAPGTLPFVSAAQNGGRVDFAPTQDDLTESNSGATDSDPAKLARSMQQSVTLTGTDSAGNRSLVTVMIQKDVRRFLANPSGATLTPNVPAGQAAVIATADGRARVEFATGTTFEDLTFRLRQVSGKLKLPPGMIAVSPAVALERLTRPGGTITPEVYVDFFEEVRGELSGTSPAKAKLPAHQIGVYRLDRRGVTPITLPTPAIAGGTANAESAASLFDNGRYRFRTRGTGTFIALADRSPPRFLPVSRNAPGRIAKPAAEHRKFRGDVYRQADLRLFLRMDDVGSGVDYTSLSVTVDGVACATDHDPDRRHVEVFRPKSIQAPGDHLLVADVRDRAGNVARTFRYAYRVLAE